VRHDFLDRHSRIQSPVHSLPAGLKLAACVGLMAATAAVPPGSFAVFGAIAALLVVVAVASRISPRFLVSRLLLLEPLALGVAGLALLQPGGGRIFAAVVARATICLFAALLLSSTTPFAEIVRVLRRLRLPKLLVTTLALMYRYLFLLTDEAQRMQRARAARTFRVDRARSWRAAATMVAQLFVRSTERAERIYAAMLARGWR